MTPTVAVVCPTYNARMFVTASVESVLAQTVLPAELIVSDDGSTDGTADLVAERFGAGQRCAVRVIRNPHQGPGATRNAGIRAARSDWIAFLDSDDEWLPNKLETVLGVLAAHPGVNLVCHSETHRKLDGSCQLLDYGARYVSGEPIGPQLFRANLFSTSALVCRRDVVVAAGLFDETLPSAQDYELWLRMAPAVRPFFVREPLGVYVDRPGNITMSAPFGRIVNQARAMVRHRRLGGPSWPVPVAAALIRGFASVFKRRLMGTLGR